MLFEIGKKNFLGIYGKKINILSLNVLNVNIKMRKKIIKNIFERNLSLTKTKLQ